MLGEILGSSIGAFTENRREALLYRFTYRSGVCSEKWFFNHNNMVYNDDLNLIRQVANITKNRQEQNNREDN